MISLARAHERRRRAVACAILALLAASPAHATEPVHEAPDPATPPPPPPPPTPAELTVELRALGRSIDADFRLFASLEFGRGFRFNNPYRLATELGTSAESVSLIAPYGDLGLGFAYGPPDGLQYGAAVHLAAAMAGVSGYAMSYCFQVTYRGPRRFLAYGRVGPTLNTPEVTGGAEIAGGFGWFVTSYLAVAGELIGDVWWGAGTHQVAVATYPILSAQLGLLVDYELLP